MLIFSLDEKFSRAFVKDFVRDNVENEKRLAPPYIKRRANDQTKFIKMMERVNVPELALNVFAQQYRYQEEGNLEALDNALNDLPVFQSLLRLFLKVDTRTALAVSEAFIPTDKQLSLPYIFLRRYQDLDPGLHKMIRTQTPFCSDQDFCDWLLWQSSLDRNEAFKKFVEQHGFQETIDQQRKNLLETSYAELTDLQKQIFLRQLTQCSFEQLSGMLSSAKNKDSLTEISESLENFHCETATSAAALDGVKRFVKNFCSTEREHNAIRDSIKNLVEYQALLQYKETLAKDTRPTARAKIIIIDLIETKRQTVENYVEFLTYCDSVYTIQQDIVYHLGMARGAWGYIKNCLHSCCSFFKPVRSKELLDDMTAAVTHRQFSLG